MPAGTLRDQSVSRRRLRGLGGQGRCRNRYCVTPRRLIEPARLAGTSMLRTQSDARLVDLVRAGHSAAFEAIVQRYRRQLLRQNGFGDEQLNESMDGVQRPDQAVELKERLRHTVKAVNELPDRQRSAILLRELEGLSYEEIAAAL